MLSPMVLLLCAMLGGSMFPYESLPKLLQSIGQYAPNRWAVLALLRTAQGKPHGGTGRAARRGLLVLGVGGCLAAFALFRKQLEDGGRA